MKNIYKIIILFIIVLNLSAETKLKYHGFLDTYYAYDNNNFANNKRPYFTQPVYEDSPNINLAHLGASISNESYRGKLVLQAGNSVDLNYLSETNDNFRYLQEGFLGYAINDKTWIDAGVYLSHIGLESFISRDNFNLTRSLVAEFSPYYQAGVRLSHDFNNKFSGQLHLLNGWQNISDDRHPALGTQLKFIQNDKISYTHNTFFGEELGGMRFFNDFLINYKLKENLDFGFQYDIGLQKIDSEKKTWNGYAIIAKYGLFDKTNIGARFERYSDPNQIIVSSLSPKGLKAYGFSVNIDQQLIKSLIWRNEVRKIYAKDATFTDVDSTSKDDLLLVTSLQYSLD